jgi:hypothetical protein
MAHAQPRSPGPRPLPTWPRMLRFGLCLSAMLTLPHSATSQNATLAFPPIEIAPNTIEYIPPIAKAVLSGDPRQVNRALETGNPNDPIRAKKGERAGFTPLILAAALSETEIAQMLIRRGAKVTDLDDFNRSAFWYAAMHENVELATALISAPGARDVLNKADSDFERTPLHLAVRSNAPQVVYLLLKAGASRNIKDILGETPLDYCKRRSDNGACEGLFKYAN